jgi:sugar lactone lactonase YvrE
VVGTGEFGYSGDKGPANRAQLNQPYDVRFSPGGDMYIADAENNVIRRVDRAGIITTVVGTRRDGFEGDGGPASQCKLNRPTSVTFDADGAMWIADSYNQRVRRVSKFLSLFE